MGLEERRVEFEDVDDECMCVENEEILRDGLIGGGGGGLVVGAVVHPALEFPVGLHSGGHSLVRFPAALLHYTWGIAGAPHSLLHTHNKKLCVARHSP